MSSQFTESPKPVKLPQPCRTLLRQSSYNTYTFHTPQTVKECDRSMLPDPPKHRRGVVAVVVQARRLLVIRRSLQVAAPGKLCFPGGGIESGEGEPVALVRELDEELGVQIQPLVRLWASRTPWGVALAWWHADLASDACLTPNPAEVAEAHWLSPQQLRAHPDLLESNHHFLDAWERGEFVLPGLDV